MGGFDYPNEFMYQQELFTEGMGAAFGIFMAIYLLVIFFSFLFSLVCYILQSLGLYTIAERRGIRNPWLAWLPLGNLWIAGSIADQYQYVAKGKIKNRRKALLALSIGVFVICFFWVGALAASAIAQDEVAAITGIFGGTFLLMVIAVVLAVLEYIVYYDLFQSCQPGNSVLYLILAILFPVTLPIFVFVCRKKDLGMPPKKAPAQEPVASAVVEAEVVAEPVQEGYASPEEFEDA